MRKWSILGALAVAMLLLIPMCASNSALAHTGPYFDKSQTYWFNPCWDGTWYGTEEESDWYHAQRGNGPNGRAEAFAGAEIWWDPDYSIKVGHAEVWKKVTCTESGEYQAIVEGSYYFWLMPAGAGFAQCSVWFSILDDITGQHLKSVNIVDRIAYVGQGGGSFADSFIGYPLIWDAVSGKSYRLELSVTASAFGAVLACCISDAWNYDLQGGTQGAFVDYFSIATTYVPPGGGCVVDDTLIQMADGTLKEAKFIKLGDMVISYDIQNGTSMNETVLSVDKAHVDTIEVFNDGLLGTTLKNQPIYARNSTFEGWIKDPMDIEIGWEVYCPLNDTWIEINETEFIEGNHKVYDILTSGPNTFIGNGILLDVKRW